MSKHRRIHLVNPKADTSRLRPLFFGKALYSPVAGLLTVAAQIPTDDYEVVLTDENIEPIDFDMEVDLVGISAMTSYVKRGYEIADRFPRARDAGDHGRRARELHAARGAEARRRRGGRGSRAGHARVLDDLANGHMTGIYKAESLHPMVGMPRPRQSLLKTNRYVNKGFIQTSRGCPRLSLLRRAHDVRTTLPLQARRRVGRRGRGAR